MEVTLAVTPLLITSRQPFAHGQTFGPVGPYEQLSGTVYFAVDPLHAANQLITDLHLAPRDPRGQVHFSADYCLVKPVEPPLHCGALRVENRLSGACATGHRGVSPSEISVG